MGKGEGGQSNGPRPPRLQHRGGTPVLVSESSEASGRSRQRGDAARDGEDRTPHRGGSDGVSCVRGDRLQVSSFACGLSDRSVGDMKYGLGLGGCVLRPPPGKGKILTSKPVTLGFDINSGRYPGDESSECS